MAFSYPELAYIMEGKHSSEHKIKAGLDVAMCIIGIYGGPIGFAISTGYYIMDSTGYIDSKLGIENDK